MVQITASKCKCSAYGRYLLFGVGTKCHGTLAKNKHILLTDKQMTTHRLSGTAGIYLCCRVFCFESYLREIQIKKNQIDQKRVKCQGQMVNALWNKQCRKNSNYCHPTCKIPERLSRNKLHVSIIEVGVCILNVFFEKPCFTLCFVDKNVKYTFHLLAKLVRCESHFKLILITQV